MFSNKSLPRGLEPLTLRLTAARANQLRHGSYHLIKIIAFIINGEDGIRTHEAIASDLESLPFDHSGTSPNLLKIS